MLKVFNQAAFQGRLSMDKYFEGWYFKHVSSNLDHVYSFIPGISLSKDNSHAFIQVINGMTGKSRYLKYSIDKFSYDDKRLYIRIGGSIFADDGIILDIKDESTSIEGRIRYKSMVKYPSSILSPGIMGWYSYVPFMECKHAIISITHGLYGRVSIEGEKIDFTGGKGYIEKDWGTSFPKEWIWLHSNNFSIPNASLTLSVANIPWLGRHFIGFISFLYDGKTLYKFATYNNSKVIKMARINSAIYISLKNAAYKIDIKAVLGKKVKLMAPSNGNMTRNIEESIDSKLEVILQDNHGSIIFNDTGMRAGLEVIDSIFGYFTDIQK